MNITKIWCHRSAHKMACLLIFICFLPSVFVQETTMHVHSHHSINQESTVMPEKYSLTPNDGKSKSSVNYSDDINVSDSDIAERDYGHGTHDHNDQNEDHSAHNHMFHDANNMKNHSKDMNHDIHSHHDHASHHGHGSHSTHANDKTQDLHALHTSNDKNITSYDDEDGMLHDQPKQDIKDSEHTNKENNLHHHDHHQHGHDHNQKHSMNMDMNMNMNDSHDMGMHGMMMMFFHTGIDEIVLFKEWKIKTLAELIGSMIGIMILGTFYEALKYLREHLFKQYISSMQFSTVAVTGESGRVNQIHKVESHRILSCAHALQTCLHVVQIVTSYFLMLIFMTYNVWLCIAVVIGSAIGYFVFGWKKATVVDITEHCH